jgi:hypothetical protein
VRLCVDFEWCRSLVLAPVGVGQEVQARFAHAKGGTEWFGGVVTKWRADGFYAVKYHDGDFEGKVRRENIMTNHDLELTLQLTPKFTHTHVPIVADTPSSLSMAVLPPPASSDAALYAADAAAVPAWTSAASLTACGGVTVSTQHTAAAGQVGGMFVVSVAGGAAVEGQDHGAHDDANDWNDVDDAKDAHAPAAGLAHGQAEGTFRDAQEANEADDVDDANVDADTDANDAAAHVDAAASWQRDLEGECKGMRKSGTASYPWLCREHPCRAVDLLRKHGMLALIPNGATKSILMNSTSIQKYSDWNCRARLLGITSLSSPDMPKLWNAVQEYLEESEVTDAAAMYSELARQSPQGAQVLKISLLIDLV